MVKWTRWTLAAPAIAVALSCDEVGTPTARPANNGANGDESGATAASGCVEDQLGGAGLCLDAGMWALEAWQTCTDQGLYLADFAPYDECGVGLFGRVRVACCGGDGVPDNNDPPDKPTPGEPCACDAATGWCPPGCDGGGGGVGGKCFPMAIGGVGCTGPEALRDMGVKACAESGAEATQFEVSTWCDDGSAGGATVTCCFMGSDPTPVPNGCDGCPPNAYCGRDESGKPTCVPVPTDPAAPCNCPPDAPYCLPAADGTLTCTADPNKPGEPVECWTDCDAAGQCWTTCSDGSGGGPTPVPGQCTTDCDSAGNCKTYCPSTGCVEEKGANGFYAQYCPDGCSTVCDPAKGCTTTCPDPKPPVECWTDCDANGSCWTKCSDGTSTGPTPPAPACEWTGFQGDKCLPYDVLKQQAADLCAAGGAVLNNLYTSDDCPGGSSAAKVECCAAVPPPVEPPPDPTNPPGSCSSITVGAKNQCLDASVLKDEAYKLCAEAGLTLTDLKPAYDCSSAMGTSSMATATCCALY